MEVEEKFILVSGLICEPTRAKMLWQLLDKRAHTAGELSIAVDVSPTSASNHLAKLLDADIIKVEMQGRHRYYSLASAEVAYVVEALANLAKHQSVAMQADRPQIEGVKYCRTCYDHLAGFVAVQLLDAMQQKGYLSNHNEQYMVTENGWEWFKTLGIQPDSFGYSRRPLTRSCLDWSERRPHLAGLLGARLFNKMLDRNWFRPVQFSRELILTSKGQQEIYELFGVVV